MNKDYDRQCKGGKEKGQTLTLKVEYGIHKGF